ncbi:MAG TPA: porin family protein [Aequorivita sp.]|nr:porin family protein [Aequorivita sp.]
MKKILLLATVVVFTLSAQSQEIRMGAKAGVNFANMSFNPDDGEDFKSRTSFHIGGLVEIPITEKFSVQPEILYSSQGSQLKYSEEFMGERISSEIKYKLDYLSIPVMAKYYVIDGLGLEAGPQFGILVSAKGDYEFSGMGMSDSGTEDIKDELKTLDIGLGFGASYRLDMGVFFGARYVLGLTDISDNTDVDFEDEVKVKNNVFQLSVGYTF